MTDRNRDLSKKPLEFYMRNEDSNYEPCVIGTVVWFCPEDNCKLEVMRSDNCCPRCGQRLDWSEAKNDVL